MTTTTNPNRLALAALLALLAGCGGGPDAQGAAPAGEGERAPTADGPVDLAALDCAARTFYAELAAYVDGFHQILVRRPLQGAYEAAGDYAVRDDAWRATVPSSVDSLIALRPTITLRAPVAAFRYDEGAGSLVVTDFGDLAVPGVVVDAAARLPFPAFDCRVGPFFSCARSPSDDAWRRDVVRQWIPLQTGAEAAVPVSRPVGDALEFEARFAPLPVAPGDSLLPAVELRSIEFFSGPTPVTRWEGRGTPAGRTNRQRMAAFEPEPIAPCS